MRSCHCGNYWQLWCEVAPAGMDQSRTEVDGEEGSGFGSQDANVTCGWKCALAHPG